MWFNLTHNMERGLMLIFLQIEDNYIPSFIRNLNRLLNDFGLRKHLFTRVYCFRNWAFAGCIPLAPPVPSKFSTLFWDWETNSHWLHQPASLSFGSSLNLASGDPWQETRGREKQGEYLVSCFFPAGSLRLAVPPSRFPPWSLFFTRLLCLLDFTIFLNFIIHLVIIEV